MELNPIINSLTETDAYKINMQAVVLDKFNQDRCRWAFRCRNNNVTFNPEMVQEISAQIDHFCTLSFSDDEREWLAKHFTWLGQSYIDFLRYWRQSRVQITINEPWHVKYNDCGLTIEASALREAKEETRLLCHDVAYVTSQKVNDPIYADKEDKIITTIFAMVSAHPLEDAVASDDIEEVKVFNFAEIGEDILVSEHRPLFAALRVWRWNYLKANVKGEAK